MRFDRRFDGELCTHDVSAYVDVLCKANELLGIDVSASMDDGSRGLLTAEKLSVAL